MRHFMAKFDFLLTPALAIPAFDVGIFRPGRTMALPG